MERCLVYSVHITSIRPRHIHVCGLPFVLFNFMSVLSACILSTICMFGAHGGQKRVMELRMAVSSCVDARNQTWVL